MFAKRRAVEVKADTYRQYYGRSDEHPTRPWPQIPVGTLQQQRSITLAQLGQDLEDMSSAFYIREIGIVPAETDLTSYMPQADTSTSAKLFASSQHCAVCS
jgi:hypothetical protein